MISDLFLGISVIAVVAVVLMIYFFKKSDYPELLNRYVFVVGLTFIFSSILEAIGKLEDFVSLSLPLAEMVLIWGAFLLILYFGIRR